MPIGAYKIIAPGDRKNLILDWSYPRSNRRSDCGLFDIEEGAEVVLLVTYEILGLDPGFVIPATADISEAFVIVEIGVDTGRGGVVHTPVEVDLARGFQFSAPALSVDVYGAYPIVDGVFQPDLKVKASVGRGGHGCGCPTRTIRAPIAGSPLAPIPVLAYSAVLISPAPAPTARLLQYTLGGVLIADSPITPETGIEAKIAQGAIFFSVANVGPNTKVSFKLAA